MLPEEFEQRIHNGDQEDEDREEGQLKRAQIEPRGTHDRLGISHPEVDRDDGRDSEGDRSDCDALFLDCLRLRTQVSYGLRFSQSCPLSPA